MNVFYAHCFFWKPWIIFFSVKLVLDLHFEVLLFLWLFLIINIIETQEICVVIKRWDYSLFIIFLLFIMLVFFSNLSFTIFRVNLTRIRVIIYWTALNFLNGFLRIAFFWGWCFFIFLALLLIRKSLLERIVLRTFWVWAFIFPLCLRFLIWVLTTFKWLLWTFWLSLRTFWVIAFFFRYFCCFHIFVFSIIAKLIWMFWVCIFVRRWWPI